MTAFTTPLLFALMLGVSATAAAQTSHTPSIAEGLSRPLLRGAAVAPDGRTIAYLQRETHWQDNEFVWQLWSADVASGRTVQLTRGRKSVAAHAWSPDGTWLAFIAERESSAAGPPEESPAPKKPAAKQIWVLAPAGGEAWQLTQSDTDIEEFHWSADGRSILFTAQLPEPKSMKTREERYGEYRVFEKEFRQLQLWRVALPGALPAPHPVAARQLTSDPALNVTSFAVSPADGSIAFSATHNPLLAFRGDADLYLLSEGKSVAKLVGLEGPDSTPLFAADGRQLAFVSSMAQPHYFYANTHLAAVDVAAALGHPATTPQALHDLTRHFDEDPHPLAWTPHGLFFTAYQRTTMQVFRLDPATLQTEAITPRELIVEDASVTADGNTLAFVAEDATHVAELYVSAGGAAPRKLTDLTAAVRDWTLGSVEVVSWKSRDGTLIEGILHKPAGYDASRRYPLLVKIHGGPTGVSQPRFFAPDYAYPVPNFLAKGALVLEPNYRGSAGYGAAFRRLNVRNLGVGDMWDVMSGVDSLIKKGLVDPDRLAAMGWSQGGYISAFLTTHTARFKAISVGAGISDWMTYYVSTDITPFTPQYLEATPWDDPKVYAKTSPITAIKDAKTPTLIQHGSADQRVPVPDSFELYRGLVDQHVDARLITYTGFGHGIDKPKQELALELANLDWFSHYLWNEPIPENSALYGASEMVPDASE
jgi:dipeptidyl aminopeptidase/acylaminoacyl peptidase